MDWVSNKWDKVILLVVALIAIGLSVKFVLDSLAYGDRFQTSTVAQDDTFPEMASERVQQCTLLVAQNTEWKLPSLGPEGGEKQIPLFKSVPIVTVSGQLIDMLDPNARPLRPPVTNAWLMEYNLDFLKSSVLDDDNDDDGFRNLEEWEAKTDPTDKASHPSFANKLELVSRRQQNYVAEFAAKPDAERYQIIRYPSSLFNSRDTFILAIGEISSDEQLRVDSYVEKEEKDGAGITRDSSELSVTYKPNTPDAEQHVLKKGNKTVIPTYFAQFRFLLDKGEDIYVKEGATFKLSLDPETEYKLVDIEEDKAVISYRPEPGADEVTVEINKK